MITTDLAPSVLGRLLNLLGVAIVGYALLTDIANGLAGWVLVAGLASLALWVALIFVPRDRRVIGDALLSGMVVLGAVATVPTNGLMIVPVAVAILRTVGSLDRPVWQGLISALVAGLIVAVASLITPVPALALLAIEGGLVIAALAGYSRRQLRTSEAQTRALLEERVVIEQQQARADALAERQAVARDIHDVLAHSLGGLVVQLDAVEALLEAGRATDAAARVHDARTLAVAGLTDARRAVGALRDESPAAVDFAASIDDLVRAHRSLGGELDLRESGERRELASAPSTALARTLQESLTNARRHAPGETVRVAVTWSADRVRLEVANAFGAVPEGSPGGGHGIRGMSERFESLIGSSFSAGEHSGEFVTVAEVVA